MTKAERYRAAQHDATRARPFGRTLREDYARVDVSPGDGRCMLTLGGKGGIIYYAMLSDEEVLRLRDWLTDVFDEPASVPVSVPWRDEVQSIARMLEGAVNDRTLPVRDYAAMSNAIVRLRGLAGRE